MSTNFRYIQNKNITIRQRVRITKKKSNKFLCGEFVQKPKCVKPIVGLNEKYYSLRVNADSVMQPTQLFKSLFREEILI